MVWRARLCITLLLLCAVLCCAMLSRNRNVAHTTAKMLCNLCRHHLIIIQQHDESVLKTANNMFHAFGNVVVLCCVFAFDFTKHCAAAAAAVALLTMVWSWLVHHIKWLWKQMRQLFLQQQQQQHEAANRVANQPRHQNYDCWILAVDAYHRIQNVPNAYCGTIQFRRSSKIVNTLLHTRICYALLFSLSIYIFTIWFVFLTRCELISIGCNKICMQIHQLALQQLDQWTSQKCKLWPHNYSNNWLE